MKEISFQEIVERIQNCDLPQFDWIVGISSGGVVPATLIAEKLECELSLIAIRYRDENNNPCFDEPQLLKEFSLQKGLHNVLLVDDVSVTGNTLKKAKEYLKNYNVNTLVLIGQGDYVIFPEITSCVCWPWKR